MTSTIRQSIYIVLALAGAGITWYWNARFINQQSGFPILQYVADNYANFASASISNDIIVVVITFLVWSLFEARRLGMRHWWMYPLLTFMVAIAFSLPLFLFMRERQIDLNRRKRNVD